MIYFTADSHFGHTNIIKLCNRPFYSTKEMDEAIIKNINDLVQPKDTLYHLGDFAFRSSKSLDEYRSQINCNNIHLLLGNHDKLNLSNKKLFSSVSYYKELKWMNNTIVMSHYPMAEWNKFYRGSIMLYGHCHGNFQNRGQSFDVGVDCWEYSPISIDIVSDHVKTLHAQ